jgi:hypothetical protein
LPLGTRGFADHENSLCPKKREGLWITAKIRRRKAADGGEHRQAAGAFVEVVTREAEEDWGQETTRARMD